MQIRKTNYVEVFYKLHESDENGAVIENNREGDPLAFVFGVGMMIPGFEEHIEGLEVGNKKAFQVKSEDAYGDYVEDLNIPIPIDNFGDAPKEDPEAFEIGKLLTLQDHNGNQHRGFVKSKTEETITVDMNHPMAGKDLYFDVEIVSIRETTPEQLKEMGIEFESL